MTEEKIQEVDESKEIVKEAIKILSVYNNQSLLSMRMTIDQAVKFLKEKFNIKV